MTRRSICWLAAAVTVALTGAAEAQGQGPGKKYALLVGVKEYNHANLPNLRHTENDVEELAKALKENGGFDEVVLLTTGRGKDDEALKPTAKNIRAQLKRLSDKVTKHDTLLIGLAGHGLQLSVIDATTKKEREESFFCPQDARPATGKPLDELKKTMIPLLELFKELEESGAGVRLMLVDACRNEPKSDRGRNMDVDNMPKPARGVAVLFSCKGGEMAFETDKLGKGHGIFFYHVIQAVKGRAKNDKGEVTWSRLAEYVIDKVSDDVPVLIGGQAKQTPQEIKNLIGKPPVLARAIAPIEKPKPPVAKVDSAELEKWYNQGVAYYFGSGVGQDYKEAVTWFRKAGDKGHPESLTYLAWMHENALGVERDYAEAKRLYLKAADKNFGGALYNLGWLYKAGRGVAQDHKEALKYFIKGADAGDGRAMNEAGMAYLGGLGVEKDYKEAVKWFRKGVEKGEPASMIALGSMYHYGYGVDVDAKEAVRLFKKGSELGRAEGMTWLGYMYENGYGVEKDLKAALAWYKKALAAGHADAKEAVERLEKGEKGEKGEKLDKLDD